MRLGVAHDFGIRNDPRKWADLLSSLGCRAAVFPLDCTADPILIDEYAAAARENDIMIAEVGSWSNTMSPDMNVKRAAVERCIKQLQLAERIGARCCVNISGAKGARWDGAYKENYSKETWDEAVATIREIIDAVGPVNTFYTIEPMPWMIPWDPDQYSDLLEAVDRPGFAVHMDVFNWLNEPKKLLLNESFMDYCFEKLGRYVKSMHIKNCRLLEKMTAQVLECGVDEGSVNLEHYIELADRVDPDMPVLIEHLNTNEEYIAAWKYLKARLGSNIRTCC